MDMYIWLLIGFVLLIKGADFFVEGASSVAKLLRIPSIIVGLTVVAMGTSLPEASVSINAAMVGQNELSLSNVVGSNIFNLLVVTGASALLNPIAVQKSVLVKDLPFSIFAAAAVLIMSIPWVFGGGEQSVLTRIEGILLLIFFILYLISTIRDAGRSRREQEGEEEIKSLKPVTTAIYLILGMAAIILGGDLVVEHASRIARNFGMSETLVGLTIVALGTSLPELVTSVVAAKKGESDLALGNVVGSNIFNLLMVLAASCALHPVLVVGESIFDMIFLILSSILVWIFACRKKSIERKEAAVMLVLYLGYLIYIIGR